MEGATKINDRLYLKLNKRLGRGSFGHVFEGLYLLNNPKNEKNGNSGKENWITVAVKELDIASKDIFLKESKALSSLNHPNIVEFYNQFEDNRNLYMVLEYCHGGDLSDLKNGKKDKENGFSESEARVLFRDIIHGV